MSAIGVGTAGGDGGHSQFGRGRGERIPPPGRHEEGRRRRRRRQWGGGGAGRDIYYSGSDVLRDFDSVWGDDTDNDESRVSRLMSASSRGGGDARGNNRLSLLAGEAGGGGGAATPPTDPADAVPPGGEAGSSPPPGKVRSVFLDRERQHQGLSTNEKFVSSLLGGSDESSVGSKGSRGGHRSDKSVGSHRTAPPGGRRRRSCRRGMRRP